MGNLGDYQRMTTLAKKLGGPKALLLVVAGLGYAVLRPAEAGARKAVRTVRERGAVHPLAGRVFEVTSDGEDEQGLRVRTGDSFIVLEGDGDAILVEVLGGESNPHMTCSQFLESVSAFSNDSSR